MFQRVYLYVLCLFFGFRRVVGCVSGSLPTAIDWRRRECSNRLLYYPKKLMPTKYNILVPLLQEFITAESSCASHDGVHSDRWRWNYRLLHCILPGV